MAQQDADGMIGIGGRWWNFPGGQINFDSEFEWRSDGKLYLHDGAGNLVEGTDLTDAEIEQLARETVLAEVLELAATKLRSGDGWDEGTTGDVLREIFHVYPEHVTKKLGCRCCRGKSRQADLILRFQG